MRLLSILAMAVQAIAVFASPMTQSKHKSHTLWKYETVPGYFKQDDASTLSWELDPKSTNFGLKPIANKKGNETDWQAFERIVNDLNHEAVRTDAVSIFYKLLYIGRAGEGLQEVEEKKGWRIVWYLGTARMDNWTDPNLSKPGRRHVQELSDAWTKQFATEHTPAPQSYHSSPLRRAMETARITFGNLTLPADRPFKPVIRDCLRARMDSYRPTQRHVASWISQFYPEFKHEDHFSQEDRLWNRWIPEDRPRHENRVKDCLDWMFETDKNTWLSITTHRKTVNAIMYNIGHRNWEAEVFADVIPVLVKATRTAHN